LGGKARQTHPCAPLPSSAPGTHLSHAESSYCTQCGRLYVAKMRRPLWREHERRHPLRGDVEQHHLSGRHKQQRRWEHLQPRLKISFRPVGGAGISPSAHRLALGRIHGVHRWIEGALAPHLGSVDTFLTGTAQDEQEGLTGEATKPRQGASCCVHGRFCLWRDGAPAAQGRCACAAGKGHGDTLGGPWAGRMGERQQSNAQQRERRQGGAKK
jgi:hypothetical protein